MNKKQILVVGRHQDTLQKVLTLINGNENWLGKGCITDEKAIEMFNEHSFDLILLGGGIEVESGINLRKLFTEQKPEIIFLQHFGGINTLAADISAALPKETVE